MAEDEVDIKEDQLEVIKQHQDQIECLFGVLLSYPGDVCASGCVGGRARFRLLLSSNQSQENIKKAKGYIFSLTAEGTEYREVVKSYDSDIINMVRNRSDEIQQLSQAVLQFLDNSRELCIYGRPASVWKAQQLIDEMVPEKTIIPDCGTGGGYINNHGGTYSQRLSPPLPSKETSSVNLSMQTVNGGIISVPDLSQLTINSEMETNKDGGFNLSQMCSRGTSVMSRQTDNSLNFASLQIDGEVLSPNVRNNVIDDDNMFSCRTSFLATKGVDLTSSKVDMGDNSADVTALVPSLADLNFYDGSSEDDLERLHISDPDYDNKLEFAFKLGYSEDHLGVALRKVGPNAGQNELLSELIKLGSYSIKPDDERVHSMDQEEWSTDSFTSSAVYSQLIQQSNLDHDDGSNLRPVVIDGSNVAMSHGNKEVFSCQGIQLSVDWFRQRGHTEITVFVPQWRKETSRPDARIKDQEILTQLEKEKILVFTPARRIGGKRVVCYDDRYILKLASETGGIVVSNDNYRDLLNESPEFRKVVEERLLMYSFVNDRFMPPDDPLGRHGPSLDNFLRKEPTQPEALPPLCPYGSKKCTYGNKCKYYHPERGNTPHKSITETLAEQARQKLQDFRDKGIKDVEDEQKKQSSIKSKTKMSLQRTKSLTPMGSELSSLTLSTSEVQRPKSADLLSDDPAEAESTVVQKVRSEKWKEADEKLSASRKKMEMAEKELKLVSSQENIYNQSQRFYQHQGIAPNREENKASFSVEQLNLPSAKQTREPLVSGHLLLAQKLSDEASDDSRSRLRNRGGSGEQRTEQQAQCSSIESQPVASHHQNQRGHQKLSRQFSVLGENDSRIRPALRHTVSHDPRKLPANYGSFNAVFPHHPRAPHNPMNSQELFINTTEPERFSSYPFTGMEAARFQSYPHPGASRQNSLADQYAFQTVASNDDVFLSEHVGLSRMQSAPIRHAEQEGNRRMANNMVRQNSSSDPQLHISGESDPVGYMSSRGTLPYPESDQNSSIPHQYAQPLYMRSTSVVPPCVTSYPYSDTPRHFSDSRSFMSANHLQTGMGGVYHQSPSVPPHVSHNPFLASAGGPSMSVGPPQHHMTPNQPGMDMPYMQPSLNSAHTQGAQMTHMMSGSGQVAWSEGVQPNTSPAKHSPLPDTAQIIPSDPRYTLYYHLCGLFPEPKVRVVMNQHPNERNPQALCAYIFGMK